MPFTWLSQAVVLLVRPSGTLDTPTYFQDPPSSSNICDRHNHRVYDFLPFTLDTTDWRTSVGWSSGIVESLPPIQRSPHAICEPIYELNFIWIDYPP